MPSQYDLAEYTDVFAQQDPNQYNKLPFYLAMMQIKRQQIWNTYDKLWGNIPWQANMGSTMKAVEAVHTPVGRQFLFPNPITQLPKKDVFNPLERTEQCNVLMHDFDSQQIYFLGSFQDFRTNQVDFVAKDIERQKGIANDMFIAGVMLQKAPFVYIVGNTDAPAAVGLGNNELVAAPYIPAGTDITAANIAAAGKNDAWFQASVAKIGSPGLKLSTLDRVNMTLRDDLGAPFFEGTQNTPKDNELIKGKYVITGSSEAFQNLKWDPNLQDFRSVDWNIVMDGFQGSIFGALTYKAVRYPLRLKADGTFPVPEIQDNGNDTVVNPEYANAPYEVAFANGADAYRTIKVGPPPKDFASGQMSESVFRGMNWNGEVALTRALLIKYAVGAGFEYDTNKRGRFLQLISSLTMGCLPTRARNCIPIIFQRQRPANQQP